MRAPTGLIKKSSVVAVIEAEGHPGGAARARRDQDESKFLNGIVGFGSDALHRGMGSRIQGKVKGFRQGDGERVITPLSLSSSRRWCCPSRFIRLYSRGSYRPSRWRRALDADLFALLNPFLHPHPFSGIDIRHVLVLLDRIDRMQKILVQSAGELDHPIDHVEQLQNLLLAVAAFIHQADDGLFGTQRRQVSEYPSVGALRAVVTPLPEKCYHPRRNTAGSGRLRRA